MQSGSHQMLKDKKLNIPKEIHQAERASKENLKKRKKEDQPIVEI